jgi:ankyrin repeat protein
MAKAKKKLLPKDFEARLKEVSLVALKSVFDHCEVDARGGYSKQTALAFNACPDDLARWLVERGADIAARDSYGETPLHARAGHWQGQVAVLLELGADVQATDSRGDTPLHKAARVGNTRTARLLLEHGARTDVLNGQGLTPLALALQQCNNAKIQAIAAVAELLLDPQGSGSPGARTAVTPEMRALVQRIGTDFEFHRMGFNPETVAATSAALDRLYALFAVPPVPRRNMHDGRSLIVAKAAQWEDRHQELWELLVPSSGAALTVQGEVIRITGRIEDEINGNGGINWDADYGPMTQAFIGHIGSGVPLPEAERNRAAQLVSEIRRLDGATRQLCELAVRWVALNPEPMALPPPTYSR